MLYLGTASAWSPHLSTSRPQNEAIHDAGLRPHHAAGQSDHDPLLFQHRYQHHDAKSGHLLYYQYEAKRHAHVVRLRVTSRSVLKAGTAHGKPYPAHVTANGALRR